MVFRENPGAGRDQESVSMSRFSIDKLMGSQTEKLKECYETLERVMPPYFFRSVTEDELQDLLPMLMDIEKKSGLQMLERADSMLMVYLKSAELNPLEVGKMMAGKRILRSVVHESKPLRGGEVLVIEQIAKESARAEARPGFSIDELKTATASSTDAYRWASIPRRRGSTGAKSPISTRSASPRVWRWC